MSRSANRNDELLGLSAGNPTNQNEDTVVLVRDGEPNAVVVLPKAPHEYERQAASELASYVEKISGARLPVVTAGSDDAVTAGTCILIGRAAFPGDGAAGDASPITPSDIEKAKGDRPNTCYEPDGFVLAVEPGCVALAGVRPEGTVYAATELLERLGCRWFFPGQLGEVLPRSKDLSLAAGKSIQCPSHEYRYFWLVALAQLDRRSATPVEERIVEIMESWYRHSKSSFKSNAPEYGHNVPLDEAITDPATVKRWIEKATAFFKANPDTKRFSLGWDDGYCPVDEATAMAVRHPWEKRWAATDPLIAWYNQIAEGVTKTFPDKEFGFLAYMNYLTPPISVIPHPSLLCCLAPIEQCPRHLPGTGECWQRDAFIEATRTWCELSDKVILFDYDPQFLVHGSLPVPCVARLRVEMPLMHRFGLRGIINCGQLSVMNQGPQFYVRAKLLWDINVDVDALLEEYFTKLYGPAAGPARAFWDALEDMMVHGGGHQHEDELLKLVYPIDRARPLLRHVEAAEAAAGTDDVLRRRVQTLRYRYDNMMLYLQFREAEDAAQFASAAELAHQIVDLHKEIEEFDITLYQRGNWNRADEETMDDAPPGWARQNEDRQACLDGTKGDLAAMLPATWRFRTDPHDEGILFRWFRSEYPTDEWRHIEVTRIWEVQGLEDKMGHGYDGVGWYRTECEIPDKFKGRPLRLNFGGVYGIIHVWVNGRFVTWRPYKLPWFMQPYNQNFDIDVTAATCPGRVNTIVIRVDNEFDWGGIYRRVFLYSPVSP